MSSHQFNYVSLDHARNSRRYKNKEVDEIMTEVERIGNKINKELISGEKDVYIFEWLDPTHAARQALNIHAGNLQKMGYFVKYIDLIDTPRKFTISVSLFPLITF